MTTTPQFDRFREVKEQSELLTAFVDFLRETKHLALCRFVEGQVNGGGWKEPDRFVPVPTTYEDLFADFFGIDQNALEQERRALLESLREGNKNV